MHIQLLPGRVRRVGSVRAEIVGKTCRLLSTVPQILHAGIGGVRGSAPRSQRALFFCITYFDKYQPKSAMLWTRPALQ